MIVLDTDSLSILQRKQGGEHDRLLARLDATKAAGEVVGVAIITFEEQMRGWLAVLNRDKAQHSQIVAYAKLRGLLDDYAGRPILDYDERAAVEFQRLVKARTRVGTMDLKIAAVTLANDALLVSRNLVDFRRVSGLRVEDWTV